MTDEQKFEEKKEGEAIEKKSGTVNELKKVETKEKTEYKPTDYEYKGWSVGVPVPEGWERCTLHTSVIRRLKVKPPKPEGSMETKTTKAIAEGSSKGDEGGQCGCC